MKRLEEIAFSFHGTVLWLAYRYSGGNKEEILYTEGWDTEQEVGGTLYHRIRQLLECNFIPKTALDFPRFLSCKTAYLNKEIPEGIKAILSGFFEAIHITCHEITPLTGKLPALNERWATPLGEHITADDIKQGMGTVLLTLQAGIQR